MMTAAWSPVILTGRMIISIGVIFIVVNQGPQGEGLLQSVYETRFFTTFRDAQYFLRIVTWSSLFLFIVFQALSTIMIGMAF